MYSINYIRKREHLAMFQYFYEIFGKTMDEFPKLPINV